MDGGVEVVGAVVDGAVEAAAAASLVVGGVGGVGLDGPEPGPDLGSVSPVSASQADPESSVPLGVH